MGFQPKHGEASTPLAKSDENGESLEAEFMATQWETSEIVPETAQQLENLPENPLDIHCPPRKHDYDTSNANSEVLKLNDSISQSNPEFIDNGDSVAVTGVLENGNPYSPSYYREQEIQSPAKNGHWFPKKSYSVLAFMIDVPDYTTTLDIFMDINPDEDPYVRYFTIYFDGNIVYHELIYSGFHGYVPIWWVSAGQHRLELEINYGGHVDRGWKLTYIQPFQAVVGDTGVPYDIWEYFPQETNALLEYEVEGGSYTKIYLKTENGNDPSPRTLYVYVNGRLKKTLSSPGSYEQYLGYWSPGTTFILGLELVGSNTYYGKRIKFNSVNHRVQILEIDRMRNEQNTDWLVSPSQVEEMVDYSRTYHLLRGYTRFDYIVDSDYIPYDGWLSGSEFQAIRSQYYDKMGSTLYQYCLVAEKFSSQSTTTLGIYAIDGSGLAIFHGACEYQAGQTDPSLVAYHRSAFLHEFNHNTGIIILDENGEVYCPNPECIMAMFDPDSPDNIRENPWCCQYYWAERESPWT